MRVGRRYKFRAQHHVPGLPEPWGSPHWHDYTVEVVFQLRGEWRFRVVEELGGRCARERVEVRVNHEELDALAAPLLAKLDGQDLNTHYPDTTVEGLSREFRAYFDADEVTVWEDNDRWATEYWTTAE